MSLDLLTQQSNAGQQAEKTGKKAAKPLPSWLVPAVILAGFAAVFTIVLWDDLKPSVKVETVRALALPETPAADQKTASPKDTPAKLLFQAAGWLEPDPLPTKVGALINGTITHVYVTEGELVKKGQKIASFDDREFKITVEQTHAAHMEAEATIRLRKAEIETAKARLQTEEASLAASLERLKRSEISYKRYAELKPGTVSEQTITDAEQEYKEQEKITLGNEAKIIAAKTMLEETRAKLDSAIALEKSTEQACNKARLDLERCEIVSPIDGRILRLYTSPGARVNAQADIPDSVLIAVLYDPKSIALKMDVPLDQAGKLAVGQQARIRCEVFPDRIFFGKVTRVAGEADIQRNTLQARVRLDNPDDMLRPGMACRAEIYTPGILPEEGRPAAENEQELSGQPVLLPENTIIENGGQPYVWIISTTDRLERKTVTLDPSKNRNGLIAVTSGVLPGEPVVINPSGDLRENAAAQSINKQ